MEFEKMNKKIMNSSLFKQGKKGGLFELGLSNCKKLEICFTLIGKCKTEERAVLF